MASRVIPVGQFDLVIFGVTGDLARRKILPTLVLPGLFHRFLVGQMPMDARIIGAARSDMGSDAFRDMVQDSLMQFAAQADQNKDVIRTFLETLDYVTVDVTGQTGWAALVDA